MRLLTRSCVSLGRLSVHFLQHRAKRALASIESTAVTQDLRLFHLPARSDICARSLVRSLVVTISGLADFAEEASELQRNLFGPVLPSDKLREASRPLSLYRHAFNRSTHVAAMPMAFSS